LERHSSAGIPSGIDWPPQPAQTQLARSR
jgi:hypothetical protein